MTISVLITNAVIKLIGELYTDDDFSEYYDAVVDRLIKAEALDSFRRDLFGILKSLCETVNPSKSSRKMKFFNSIVRYIEDNYNDQRLNVSFVANRFGMTPSCLSKRFREFTGDVLMDYINNTRLRQVKALLTESGDSVSRIAQATGFTNSNTLIRIFKKYESLTPGQYKELHASKHP